MISVIIPTYNRAHLLPITLQSVLAQTYTDYEIIVIDDGSTDDTAQVMTKYPKVKYIKHDRNLGVSEARNTGLKAANGDYIAFIDSDDIMLPDKLEKQIDAIMKANNNVGLVYSPAIRVTEISAEIIPKQLKSGNVFNDALKLKWHYFLQSMLIKHECFKNVGDFDNRLKVAEDFEMLLRITNIYNVAVTEKPLCIINSLDSGISRNQTLYIQAFETIIEKHKSLYDANSLAKSSLYKTIGHLLIMTGDITAGIRYFLKSITNNPMSINNTIILFGIAIVYINKFTRLKIYSKLTDIFIRIRK